MTLLAALLFSYPGERFSTGRYTLRSSFAFPLLARFPRRAGIETNATVFRVGQGVDTAIAAAVTVQDVIRETPTKTLAALAIDFIIGIAAGPAAAAAILKAGLQIDARAVAVRKALGARGRGRDACVTHRFDGVGGVRVGGRSVAAVRRRRR
jgi:hypothetical protein